MEQLFSTTGLIMNGLEEPAEPISDAGVYLDFLTRGRGVVAVLGGEGCGRSVRWRGVWSQC